MTRSEAPLSPAGTREGDELTRIVTLSCPRCGGNRPAVHIDGGAGRRRVRCSGCDTAFDPVALRTAPHDVLPSLRAAAADHAGTALRIARDGVPCSYLAVASCRRVAAEMTVHGRARLFREILLGTDSPPTAARRAVAGEIGAALGLPTDFVRAALALS